MFSRKELEDARKAFLTWQRKITKVKETLSKRNPPPKSQMTLTTRNLNAICLSLKLINRELEIVSEKA